MCAPGDPVTIYEFIKSIELLEIPTVKELVVGPGKEKDFV